MGNLIEQEEAAMTIVLDREELEILRGHLLQIGPDYCGASEVIRAFLSLRGYGISPTAAQHAAVEFGRQGCSLESIAHALGQAAWVN
ncbi:MAG: hypothetical protein ACRD1E_07635 [Terriglobales bacterium]